MVKQVRLGKSDVNVFPIALGTNAVGGHNLYPNLDEEQGKEVVRQAIDNGITLLDTAYIYGPERSEELVGQVVKEYPREKVQIATKGSHVIKENGEVVQNNDPEYLKQQVENSLERLQVIILICIIFIFLMTIHQKIKPWRLSKSLKMKVKLKQ